MRNTILIVAGVAILAALSLVYGFLSRREGPGSLPTPQGEGSLLASTGLTENETIRKHERFADLESQIKALREENKSLAKLVAETREELDQGLEFLDEQQSQLEETTLARIKNLQERMSSQVRDLVKRIGVSSNAEPGGQEKLQTRLLADGVTLDLEGGRVEVEGQVLQRDVLVEFVAVTRRGKTHESLFLLSCKPSALNAGLLALGLEPGKPYEVKPESEVPQDQRAGAHTFELEDLETEEKKVMYYYPPRGAGVTVTVSWESEGTQVEHRIEELILDSLTGSPLKPMEWIYLGSRFEYNPDTGEEFFVADYTGDVISIWHSYQGNTILDNPLVAGRDDEIYVANHNLLPAEETPVTLVFERAP